MKKQIQLNRKGITLIELLVAFVICGIVVAGIYRVFVAQTRAYAVQDQVVEVQQNIRTAMEVLLRDLRMAGYDDDSLTSKVSVANPIVNPSDHSVTVNYEYDDTHRYEITYSLDVNGNLTRQLTIFPDGSPSSSTTDTILENVEALAFRYGIDTNDDGAVEDWVDAAGIGINKVVAVRVVLTARSDQTNPDVSKVVSPRTLTSAVTLRNQCLR
jgi:Tfp pilus assembly protein PilW